MKIYSLILGLLIISCNSNGNIESDYTTQKQKNSEFVSLKKVVKSHLTSQGKQDSLRLVLINSKPNSTLKSSVLKEYYIRGLVNQVKNKITFHLPFNLHGLDCGAPDCYSTDIRFKMEMSQPIEFPEHLEEVELYTHGCVEQAELVNTTFVLKENTPGFVNYFSKELKSNLVLKKSGALYYYPHQNTLSVSCKAIENKFNSQAINNQDVLPLRSSVTTTQFYDYQFFIERK